MSSYWGYAWARVLTARAHRETGAWSLASAVRAWPVSCAQRSAVDGPSVVDMSGAGVALAIVEDGAFTRVTPPGIEDHVRGVPWET